MCVYCSIGDHAFRHNPPWDEWSKPNPNPFIPRPAITDPITPWKLERLKEYLEILKEVKALEDRIGCPCEPNKADYIGLIKQRIEALEIAPDGGK